MPIVFDGSLYVSYGNAVIAVDQDEAMDADFDNTFEDQINGLLGVSLDGAMLLRFGLHSGHEALRIEWHPAEPVAAPLDEWEDVVEASTNIRSRDLGISVFDDWVEFGVAATGSHRLRYCATGLDAAFEEDFRESLRPGAPDRYLLQMWPEPPSSDVIVRQGSVRARVLHQEVAS